MRLGEDGRRDDGNYLDEGPHGEEVGQHGGQALGQAALGDEARFQLGQADGIIALLPVPARNVQQMGLCPATTYEHGMSAKSGMSDSCFFVLFVFCEVTWKKGRPDSIHRIKNQFMKKSQACHRLHIAQLSAETHQHLDK